MCRNAAQRADRPSISPREGGVFKFHAHTRARPRANTVVCANDSTGLLAACFLTVFGLALDVCFFFFFLPGAVLTVDAAPEGQLLVVKVVLRLLRDAPFFPHAVRHLVLHLRCRTRENGAR